MIPPTIVQLNAGKYTIYRPAGSVPKVIMEKLRAWTGNRHPAERIAHVLLLRGIDANFTGEEHSPIFQKTLEDVLRVIRSDFGRYLEYLGAEAHMSEGKKAEPILRAMLEKRTPNLSAPKKKFLLALKKNNKLDTGISIRQLWALWNLWLMRSLSNIPEKDLLSTWAKEFKPSADYRLYSALGSYNLFTCEGRIAGTIKSAREAPY